MRIVWGERFATEERYITVTFTQQDLELARRPTTDADRIAFREFEAEGRTISERLETLARFARLVEGA